MSNFASQAERLKDLTRGGFGRHSTRQHVLLQSSTYRPHVRMRLYRLPQMLLDHGPQPA